MGNIMINYRSKRFYSVGQEVLNDVQKYARVRTISLEDIRQILDTCCYRCIQDLRISKRSMEGTTVTIDYNACNFPNSYNGIPESTLFTAVWHNGSWYVTSIYRGKTRPKDYRVTFNFSSDAIDCMVSRAAHF